MLYPTDKPAYAAIIKTNPMNIIKALPALVLYLLATSLSHATLTPIGPFDFASGATVLNFSTLADNTEANGLGLDGVLCQVTKNGSSTNGIVIVGGGPGITGNISPPNLVSIADLDGVALIVSLPKFNARFGCGCALRVDVACAVART